MSDKLNEGMKEAANIIIEAEFETMKSYAEEFARLACRSTMGENIMEEYDKTYMRYRSWIDNL